MNNERGGRRVTVPSLFVGAGKSGSNTFPEK